MAFTKIAAAGIGSTGTVTLENLVVTGGGGFGFSATATLGGSGIVIIAYPS